MRRKTIAQKKVSLTDRYRDIGISAVAAAARYQRNEKNKERPAALGSKSKSQENTSFRGTLPRR
jgi:hypothetical protein